MTSRMLGVFAHPDDEVFCAGGTFARYADEGAEIMCLTATRGEAGQIRDARAATRRTLAAVREKELHAACEAVGVKHVKLLDYMDGTLKDVDLDELVDHAVRSIREFRPDVVITFGDDGAYGHPDHVTICHAATEAFRTVARERPGGYAPARLYHSHFPRSRMLMLDRLTTWLMHLQDKFKGGQEFIQALSLFAQETITLGYASDFVDVKWFPADSFIVEQGEASGSLFLVLSGQAIVTKEDDDGNMNLVGRLGPGEFFGELGLALKQRRAAHVIAVDNVTCLVMSPGQETLFMGRGTDATLGLESASEGGASQVAPGATTCIDVSKYVERKVAGIAAHHTQYPITPDMFPAEMLQEMFGKEYYVRVEPPFEVESDLMEGSVRV
jgi:LmbE family N-acetylglucosaminyl deacetylase